LMEERKDPESLEVYLKTLDFYPDDREILRIVSHIYHDACRFDDAAEGIYRRAVVSNPADVPTLLALTHIARDKQDDDLAVSSIEKLVDLGQYNHDLVIQLAEAYRRRGFTGSRAEKVYQAALKTWPDHAEYILLLAGVYIERKQTDALAMHAYEAALKLNQNKEDIGKQLIRTYIENRRFESASRLAAYFLKRNPGDQDLQRLMALADLQSNKIDEAIAEYRSILSINPRDTEALVNMALAYAMKKLLTDEARDIYQKALSIVPDNPDLLRIMACHHISHGMIDEGLKSFDQAFNADSKCVDAIIEDCLYLLAENPDCIEVRYFLSERLLQTGRLRELLEQIQTIFESDPSQVNRILPFYDQILKNDPNNVLARIRQGVLLKIIGQTERALHAMEMAFNLMQNNSEVQTELTDLYEFILEEGEDIEIRFRLGKVYMLMEQYEKAIGCFQKTAQDFRWESESIKCLGMCFVQKGMLDLALQEFKKLIIDDELKEILYDLALRYEAKNDLVGAKHVYRQLFAADINFKNVRERFEMLAGSTSDPIVFEKTTIINSLSDKAKRRYELLEELGRGAMGIVYRARDNELEDIVALKILPDNLSNNPEAVQRFKSEARSARRLSHPNIVRIHDIGEEMGRKYISMEFVDGMDLKRILRNTGSSLPVNDVAQHMIQTARALSYAHSIGIIHRDVKPANIMLTQAGVIKVTDFGIAKMIEGVDRTVAGAVIGTPLYMSPEQVKGLPVDNRADIYSLGITMYELLCGRPPFCEGDLAYQHLHVDPIPIAGIPDIVMTIVLK
ncbi:MAG TPA: protein kinase, partial [Candidatus Sumerlaeota bacterium]|nr:protein kinase [Candidatus Sumerlaeota bacterium]